MEINIKESLSCMREKCFGMPECVYQFAEYVATIANDRLTPEGVALTVALAFADVKRGYAEPGHVLPTYLKEHRKAVLPGAKFILQVIDETVGGEFAEAVRAACKESLGWDVTKRVGITDKDELADHFEPCIVAAVNWWAARIQLKNKAGRGDALPSLYKEFTDVEIWKFRMRLALKVDSKFSRCGFASLAVDYYPDQLLSEAGVEAGVDENLAMFIFPAKTKMRILSDRVEVAAGYGADFITIWEAK